MRDVRTTTAQAIRYTYKQYEDGGRSPNSGTVSVAYTNRSVGRGDLLKSNHKVATNYGAYRHYWSCPSYLYYGPRGVEYAYDPKIGLINRYYRDAYAGQELLSAELSTVSCSTSDSGFNSLLARTRNNLLNGVANSDVDIGTFFGELPESVGMILKTSIALLSAARAARRGNWSQIPKLLGCDTVKGYVKTPANAWFAYQFGWKPLIDDVYNMHSSVLKQLSKPSTRKSSATLTGRPNRPNLSKSLQIGTDEIGAKCTVHYQVESSWVHNAQAFGLLNPAAVLWELVPMSFVVDWFIPIGGFIRNCSATAGLEWAHGHETRYASVRVNVTATPLAGTTGTYPASHYTGFSFTRNVLSTFPSPNLRMSLDLNRNQVLTLLGLISQRL